MKNRLLRLFTLLFAVTVLLLPLSGLDAQTKPQAKNVIIFIGDGFGPTSFAAAYFYSNRVLNKDLHMSRLMKEKRTAYIMTDTADTIVTESAAAASQIATGQRMTFRALNMAVDGKTPVKTIMEMAKEQNKKLATGLVTTSGITDATPAAFVAHVTHRKNEEEIADQELKFGVDVLMGGRKKFFLPKSVGGKRTDGRNLLEEAQKAGYTVVGTAEELKAAPIGKVLGLFNMDDMRFEIDRATTTEPSLAEMTDKTLQILSKSKSGFFVMIEGGRIDHAEHYTDAPATIREVLAFDDALGVAMDFAKKNPATLLIVTADHETGGMALIGHSKKSKEYIGIDLKAIEKSKASFEMIFEVMASKWGTEKLERLFAFDPAVTTVGKVEKPATPEQIKEVIKQYMDINLTDDEARTVAEDTIGKLEPYNTRYKYLRSLSFVLQPYLRVGWASQTHTASPIFLFGSGPGSEKIGGLMHNTEIFTIMKGALRLK